MTEQDKAALCKKTKAQLVDVISTQKDELDALVTTVDNNSVSIADLNAQIEHNNQKIYELNDTIGRKNAVIESLKLGNEDYAKELLDANNLIATLNKTIETKDKLIDIKISLVDDLKNEVKEKQDRIEALESVVEFKTASLEESYNETLDAKALAELYLDRIKDYKKIAIILGVTTLVLLLVVIFS